MDGRRLCTTCLYYKPIDDFKRRDVKRQDPTKMCTGCRDIAKKSSRKPTSRTGMCRTWVEWKENRKCENCGIREESVIESHHRDPTRKKHKCSQWKWWTYNGGPEALAKELAKCQALCRACHRMEHSWRSKPKSPNALFVDAVGECECGSGCGKKVTHRSKR